MDRLRAALLPVVLMPALAFAGDGVFSDAGFQVSGDASVYSQYVWRGMVLDRDAVLQTGFYLSTPDKGSGKLTAKLWVNHDLENEDGLRSDEQDYTIDYTYALGGLSLSAGNTYYDFSGTGTYSKEWYAGITPPVIPCPSIGPLKGVTVYPSFFFYRDYGDPKNGGGNGTYAVVNLGIGVPVAMGRYACSFDLAGHLGYNHKDFINGDGQDLGLSAGFTMPFAKSATLSPSVNYSIPYGDLKKADDGNQKRRLFWGVTAKCSF